MKKKETRGGKRNNSGRKKAKDPKKQVDVYVESSKVDKLGGKEGLKEFIYSKIDEAIDE